MHTLILNFLKILDNSSLKPFRIDFGNSEILDYNIDYEKRKFLESLYINNTKNSINDKDRNVFPKIYSNIKNLN